MSKPIIDWSPAHANGWPEQTIECCCGKVYRSHCKFTLVGDGPISTQRLVGVTEKDCPGCGVGHDHIRAARSDPEEWVVRA